MLLLNKSNPVASISNVTKLDLRNYFNDNLLLAVPMELNKTKEFELSN
jgi:hypothetical protein